MTDINDEDDRMLGAAFFAARTDERAAPDAAFMARLLDDALAQQPVAGVPDPRAGGVLAGLVAAIGGWPGLTGMVSAGVAGVVIGVAVSGTSLSGTLDFVPGFSADSSDYLMDFETRYDALIEEG